MPNNSLIIKLILILLPISSFCQHNENALSYKVDTATGELLNIRGQRIKSSYVLDTFLARCSQNNVKTVFIGDVQHSKPTKIKVVLGQFEYLKKYGYSFGLEEYPNNFSNSFGQSFESISLSDLQQRHDSFILYQVGAIRNKTNIIDQSERIYQIYYNAKQLGVKLFFCEKCGSDDSVDNRILKFRPYLRGKDSLYDFFLRILR